MVEIRHVKEHIEVYTKITGQFLFSADTEQEAEHELKIMEGRYE